MKSWKNFFNPVYITLLSVSAGYILRWWAVRPTSESEREAKQLPFFKAFHELPSWEKVAISPEFDQRCHQLVRDSAYRVESRPTKGFRLAKRITIGVSILFTDYITFYVVKRVRKNHSVHRSAASGKTLPYGCVPPYDAQGEGAMQPDKKRYEALDGWRGISACLVVLYHFCTVSHIYQARLIRAGFLWVDFFFVLSGFIITANYRDRLMNGFPARKFLFLRLGRIYPLHIFMLALTVGHEILKPILLHEPAFSSCDRSVRTLIANILLLHSVQGSDCMSWNAPSWSISAEWFAYALFALGIRVLKSRVWMVELALTIVSPIILACYHSDLNITSRLSLLRCLYGFSLGAICYRVHMAYLDRGVYNRWAMTFVEIALLLAGFYLAIYMHQKLSILAPFLFASMILVFAQESGAISELLKTCPMKLLGVLSYPIYMAHFFIQRLVYNAAALAGKKLHASAFTRKNWFGKDVKMINTSLWQGDVLMVAILVIVIPASYVTWQYIEVPAHNWFRRRAQTWFPERNGPWGFSHAFGGS